MIGDTYVGEGSIEIERKDESVKVTIKGTGGFVQCEIEKAAFLKLIMPIVHGLTHA